MRMVIGIDPGSMTGVCAYNREGIVASWQDEKTPSMRALIQFFKANRDDVELIAIEDAFIGKGRKSSLTVAKNSGWAQGALWCAGWAGTTWEPIHSEWRKVHGFKRKTAHEEAIGFAKARSGKAFDEKTIHEAEAICIAAAAFERLSRNLDHMRVWAHAPR